MGEGKYNFLRELDEGEFRIWLAAQFEGLNGRINVIEDVQEHQRKRVEAVALTSARRAWVAPALKWLLVALASVLAATGGWALARVVGG